MEDKLNLIQEITNDTLEKTSDFFLNRKIFYNTSIIKYIRNPQPYPGNHSFIIKIVKKFLDDAISERYEEIQKIGLQFNFIEKSVLNNLFKGERYSGNPGSPQHLKSKQKTNKKEVV